MEIKLNDIMTAYTNADKAWNSVEFYRRAMRERPNTRDWTGDLEKAKATHEEAEAEFARLAIPVYEEIKAAEGKARTRTLLPCDIVSDLLEVESHLGISMTAMKGITVTINHTAQSFPSAYRNKGTPESTYFRAEHTGRGWKLTRIYRDTCRATKCRIELTEEAKTAIIRNAESF